MPAAAEKHGENHAAKSLLPFLRAEDAGRMVSELIDHIDVYHAEKQDGVTNQQVVIHYNCIGAFEVPDRKKIPEADIIMETRKGVAVSYAPRGDLSGGDVSVPCGGVAVGAQGQLVVRNRPAIVPRQVEIGVVGEIHQRVSVRDSLVVDDQRTALQAVCDLRP